MVRPPPPPFFGLFGAILFLKPTRRTYRHVLIRAQRQIIISVEDNGETRFDGDLPTPHFLKKHLDLPIKSRPDAASGNGTNRDHP